jgi:hypothetical protein
MVRKITRTVVTALCFSAFSACGSGSGSAPALSPRGPVVGSPVTAQTFSVSLVLFVPKPMSSGATSITSSSSARRALYLPTSVNSVTVQQTESGGSVVTGAPVAVLVIGGSNCSASAGGQTCTLTLQGALGQNAWSVATFVTGDGTGSAISLNTGTLMVLKGAANVLALTLNPILASLAFVPLAYSANATSTSTLPLVLQAKDTSGAIIIGPGIYVSPANVANPITLLSSSAAHVVLQTAAATAATVTLTTTAANDLAQIAYDGTLVAGSQTITASATGITTATLALTLTLAAGGLSVPASIALGADLTTTSTALAISEPGFGGMFTLTSSSCAGIVTFSGTAGPGPSTSSTITQAGGGTCTILVSDGINSTSVIVYSTTVGITLQ